MASDEIRAGATSVLTSLQRARPAYALELDGIAFIFASVPVANAALVRWAEKRAGELMDLAAHDDTMLTGVMRLISACATKAPAGIEQALDGLGLACPKIRRTYLIDDIKERH